MCREGPVCHEVRSDDDDEFMVENFVYWSLVIIIYFRYCWPS